MKVRLRRLRVSVSRVQSGQECPNCRESRMDFLVWNKNGKVACRKCGKVYVPGEETKDDGRD